MRVLTTVIAHPDSLASSPPAWLCIYVRRTGILSLLSLKKTRPPLCYMSVDPTAVAAIGWDRDQKSHSFISNIRTHCQLSTYYTFRKHANCRFKFMIPTKVALRLNFYLSRDPQLQV